MNKKIKINWEGSLFVHHSLGMVNREILYELIKRTEFEIRVIPFEPDQFIVDSDSKFYPLFQIAHKPPHDAPDITVKHRWPPDFSSPANGRFVLFQPWEYGSLPAIWLSEISTKVDDVWVYTDYLKRCYAESGIDNSKIKIIPLGVDTVLFNPSKKPSGQIKYMSSGRYCFLFNGGVTFRKGTDILVNAYLNEFKADEPVCLIIKDSSAYGKGLAEKVRLLSQRPDIARIVYFCENISHGDLAGLYTACDCYVHPYRAEGYGLPIAEAISCGRPVVVTGGGACIDFVKPGMGYFINCAVEKMKEKNVNGILTVDHPFWLVPDTVHLQKILRYIYENQNEAKALGNSAGINFRASNTWSRSAEIVSKRLIELI